MGEAAVDLARENGVENRIMPRAAVEVCIDLSSEHNFWTGLTMNISEGGVFVATHKIVPVGTTLGVEMTLPGDAEPVMALAEVRWSRDYTGNPDAPPGLGLQFVSLEPCAVDRIRAFVEKVREPLFFDAD